MTPPSSIPATGGAPFDVHSVHFDFPGGQAIHLRDPASNHVVGADPEWIGTPPRDELAAYARNTRPSVQVVFRGSPAADGTYSIGAGGAALLLVEQRIPVAFDPATGLSSPVVLWARNRLPDRIGLHSVRLDWYVRSPADSAFCLLIGTTLHRIGTTWKRLQPCPVHQLHDWVYKPLMVWTCEWAAGQDDEKDICDAIIGNLPASGLRYGVAGHDVRQMLLQGGGMCGGWYQMFQQLAHCQGVFVHRRCFLVDWRQKPNGEEQWCALVICNGGLNQLQPTHPPSQFHDNDTLFPISAPVTLTTRVEQRYRFWGRPGFYRNGHCINFLEHKGRLYLYDASFAAGPFEIASLPPDDFSLQGVASLSSFKARYLDGAVDYMLGTLYNGSILHRSVKASGTNGMTVKTALISDLVENNPGLTFYWGP